MNTLAIIADETITMSDLIVRYELSNRADCKSLKTIAWYTEILKSFSTYLERKPLMVNLSTFNIDIVRGYILYLRQKPRFEKHPYTPQQEKPVSVTTIQCHIRTLKAFSSWLFEEGYTVDNRLKNLKLPKAPSTIIQPLTEKEIEAILNRVKSRSFTGMRNHAIITILLDTGLRASEIADASLVNVNLDEGYIKVMGKGSKERFVPIGSYAQKVLWQYINTMKKQMPVRDHDKLFVSSMGRPITVNTIKLHFSRLAKKTGIARLHAHLCRHTFSVNYLLNGGDIFTLQEILGHTTLDMVKHYLHFTRAQVAVIHHKYSPMDKFYKARHN